MKMGEAMQWGLVWLQSQEIQLVVMPILMFAQVLPRVI